MIKKLFLLVLLASLLVAKADAQNEYADSLKLAFKSATIVSYQVSTLSELSNYYSFLYPDSALYYAEEIIDLSKKTSYPQGEAMGLLCKSQALDVLANYPEALKAAYESLEISEGLDAHSLYMTGWSYDVIGHLHAITGNNQEGILLLHKAIDLLKRSGEGQTQLYYTQFSMAFSMLLTNQIDSAFYYIDKGNELRVDIRVKRNSIPWLITGNVYESSGDIPKAVSYFREGLKISEKFNTPFFSAIFLNGLASTLVKQGQRDSAIYYAKKSLSLSQKYRYKLFEINVCGILAYGIYDGVNSDSAIKYMKMMIAANDEAFSPLRSQQFQQVRFDVEKREKDQEDATKQFQSTIRLYGTIIALIFSLVVALIFWRNNRQKKKANMLLTDQKGKLESALEELKTTQAQLIQSEKMASLGELTAGIAHEIQNPLNFVSNFSEVNKELLEEMREEIGQGNLNDLRPIVNNVIENHDKIDHHSKRAAAIVKGMLLHSRNGSGQKELTEINVLADEYLRLSYHGLRARDRTFNATLQTNFDKNAGRLNIVPQDIGRVILNLLTNAFYAVSEKKKQQPEGYEPTVRLDTKRTAGKVEIRVTDNGNGIPKEIMNKIFQPFFTTKPAGQGTGLGLSLAYEIITKGYGGDLKIETEESKFTTFIITLPTRRFKLVSRSKKMYPDEASFC